ncbi:hypothetical protein B0T14DRAFT_591933 [Immersiella caudata]|uniref:Uncharacterized protein n=1 Tax=Immersiella caudata TaxID=314043 RepID=A0AA40BUC4_9PEZI|nr:hypothetical protein B0T14DRAFT_591933 [Immersiella caudata]
MSGDGGGDWGGPWRVDPSMLSLMTIAFLRRFQTTDLYYSHSKRSVQQQSPRQIQTILVSIPVAIGHPRLYPHTDLDPHLCLNGPGPNLDLPSRPLIRGRDVIYRRFVNELEAAASASARTIAAEDRPDWDQLPSNVRVRAIGCELITEPSEAGASDPLDRVIQSEPLRYSHLRQVLASDHFSKRATLFVAEDYNKELISILGKNLAIPCGFFADHYSTDEGTVHTDSIRNFPTCEADVGQAEWSWRRGEATRVIIRYPVIAPQDVVPNSVFKKRPEYQGLMTTEATYANWMVERQIETPTKRDRWDHQGLVVTASAQLSYWVSECSKEGVRNAGVLLVDPSISYPPGKSLFWDQTWANLVRIAEFSDPTTSTISSVTPSADSPPPQRYTNTSLYDDIRVFALSNPATREDILAFARLFAINKWIGLINHARACLAKLRAKLYAPGIRRDNHPIDGARLYRPNWAGEWSEWVLERLADWTAGLALYQMEVESNMLALRIDPENATSYGVVGKQEAQRWHYIRRMLLRYRELYMQTSDS